MSNSLSFDLAPTETGRRLAITGPTALMLDATAECSPQFQAGRVPRNRNRMYSHALSDDGSMLTWALNAKRLGMLHDQKARDKFLVDTNGFIDNLLSLAHDRKVRSDPRLSILAYESDGTGEFSFVADAVRPAAKPDIVKHLIIGAMMDMVGDLRYPRRGDQEEIAHSTIGYRTRFDDTALIMHLSPESQVSSTRQGWNWSDGILSMEGRNVQDGAEPLIYLAGAIAMAKADVLLNPRTLVVQS